MNGPAHFSIFSTEISTADQFRNSTRAKPRASKTGASEVQKKSASEREARDSIAGFTVINDVTARDWQNRTLQWLQGKTFEGSTPVGPNLVTMDVDKVIEEGLGLSCEVNGEEMQRAVTSDLLFNPVFLVSYISKILTLRPGDVIATGTPGGVGHARNPQRYLKDGDILVTRVEGVGELRNICKSA